MTGGGNIKKFDIINYVNGNKRKEIKERIINMIYVDFENEDTMGYIYDQGWPNDFEMNLNDKKRSMINDEIMDTCFDAFVRYENFYVLIWVIRIRMIIRFLEVSFKKI